MSVFNQKNGTEHHFQLLSNREFALAEFGKVDPALPALVIESRNAELQRKFRYAVSSLAAGVLVTFGILGSFVYLVMSGHPQAAACLLGAGVLSLVGGFLRSRL